MVANPDIIDPHLNWGEQEKSIRLEVDQDRARALGLTPLDVAQTMQTMLSGYTVTQYREGIETIDVVARAVPSERLVLDRLSELTTSTRTASPFRCHRLLASAASTRSRSYGGAIACGAGRFDQHLHCPTIAEREYAVSLSGALLRGLPSALGPTFMLSTI